MALASEVQRLANQVGLQLTDNPYTTVDPQVRTGVPLTRLMLHEEGCVKTQVHKIYIGCNYKNAHNSAQVAKMCLCHFVQYDSVDVKI